MKDTGSRQDFLHEQECIKRNNIGSHMYVTKAAKLVFYHDQSTFNPSIHLCVDMIQVLFYMKAWPKIYRVHVLLHRALYCIDIIWKTNNSNKYPKKSRDSSTGYVLTGDATDNCEWTGRRGSHEQCSPSRTTVSSTVLFVLSWVSCCHCWYPSLANPRVRKGST